MFQLKSNSRKTKVCTTGKPYEFNRDLVYFGKIKDLGDGTDLITIGWTGDIQYETLCMNKEFGSMAVIDTFLCSENIRFKTFLHRHDVLCGCQYTKPVNNKRYSCLVFRMSPRNLEEISRVAKNAVGAFRSLMEQYPDEGILDYVPEPDDGPESDVEPEQDDEPGSDIV